MKELKVSIGLLIIGAFFVLVGGLADWTLPGISPMLSAGGFVLKTFGIVICAIVISVWVFVFVVGGVALTLGLLRVGVLILHGYVRGKK